MINLDLSSVKLRLRQAEGKTFVFDPVRKKWLVLTPEEHVRQRLLAHLVEVLQYPASLVAVEKTIKVGSLTKRFDVVVYSRDHKPWLLAECKAPEIMITENTLHQLLAYQSSVQCSYWVLTNGHQVFCADARNVQDIKWMPSLPAYEL